MNTKIEEFKAGLIGSGIQASLTPAMHMREGEAQCFRYQYELIDLKALGLGVDALAQLLDDAQARGLGGLNITHPAKQKVVEFLDELSPDAKALGSVNTVVLRDGKRVGHNTDWWGFAESFKRGLPDVDLTSVVQLGAGGAGVATAYAILKLGAKRLTLIDPDGEKVRQTTANLQLIFPDADLVAGGDVGNAMAEATGLIHATPTGMASYPGLPLDADLIQPRQWVAEIVYFPLETELVRTARAKGCAVLNGGGMAVFQAVGAFQLFTGLEADAKRMLAHFFELTGQ